MRCHIRGNTLLPPAPSTNVAFQFANTCAEPLANESIAGADRPDAAPPLDIGQECNSVGSASQLVGVDRLEVLELEPDVGESRPEFEAHKRCADDGPGDTLLGIPDLVQGDRTDRFKHAAPAPRLPHLRPPHPPT